MRPTLFWHHVLCLMWLTMSRRLYLKVDWINFFVLLIFLFQSVVRWLINTRRLSIPYHTILCTDIFAHTHHVEILLLHTLLLLFLFFWFPSFLLRPRPFRCLRIQVSIYKTIAAAAIIISVATRTRDRVTLIYISVTHPLNNIFFRTRNLNHGFSALILPSLLFTSLQSLSLSATLKETGTNARCWQ